MDIRAVKKEFNTLRRGWDSGNRDREDSLHLLYFCWMHWAEPGFLTGLPHDPTALDLWHDIFAYFGGEDSADAEFLHVAGMMAEIFPYALGDETTWEATAQRMKERSLKLKPDGFPPKMFAGRGEYGGYFEHQAQGEMWRILRRY